MAAGRARTEPRRTSICAGLIIILALLLPACARIEAVLAPESELWGRWTTHDPGATSEIDHTAWDRFLQSYVSTDATGLNRVAYGRVNDADRAALDRYIGGLTNLSIGLYNRDEQRAYWINLYNALTVKLLLDFGPVKSIQDIDISPGFLSIGPWDKKLVYVGGEAISLNDIEHRILRPIWRDPRIHYGVNCASIGCPNLQTIAYTSANVEGLLNKGARDYVNNPRGVSIQSNRLQVSSIYNWFKEDFGETDAAVIAHLRNYADPGLAARLSGHQRIDDYVYDWRLNASP